MLTCIKSRGPLSPSALGLLLERGPNSMSMLVDRMVKAGLVRRRRDRKDRRVVFVTMTSKGRRPLNRQFQRGGSLSIDSCHAIIR